MSTATNNQNPDEENEDYMGDLSQFLPSQNSQPLESSSRKSKTSESLNTKPKRVKWQDQRKLKREKTQEEEDKQTLVNLESAIPQSNIGFKLLKQMGYTPGLALGKEGGLSEPVGIQIRRTRAGIGRQEEKLKREEEKLRRAEERIQGVEELVVDFGFRKKEQWRTRRIVFNFHKAKATLAQLENKEEVVEVEKKESDDDDKEEEEEEEEEVITQEDLLDILMRLRDEYHYCLFCGCQYESMEGLVSNCPGIEEDDH